MQPNQQQPDRNGPRKLAIRSLLRRADRIIAATGALAAFTCVGIAVYLLASQGLEEFHFPANPLTAVFFVCLAIFAACGVTDVIIHFLRRRPPV